MKKENYDFIRPESDTLNEPVTSYGNSNESTALTEQDPNAFFTMEELEDTLHSFIDQLFDS